MDFSSSTAITIRNYNHAKIHTFIAPYKFAANATHIIESENRLVLVDTQFIKPMSQAFKNYAINLDKPIERIFISHAHPDHYFGLSGIFSDIPAYSLTGIIDGIAHSGPQMVRNQKPAFGDLIPDEVTVPSFEVEIGREVIDGITYEYSSIEHAESELQLIIKLPELCTVVAQDVIYSGMHLWLGLGQFQQWKKALQQLIDNESYDYFLAGHGVPCLKEELVQNQAYLEVAQGLFEQGLSAMDFKQKLLQRFPHRASVSMFDLYLGFLFAGDPSH